MVSAGRRRILVQLLVGVGAIAATFGAGAAIAKAPLIENGGFETGSLKGWKTSVSPDGEGKWSVYSGNSIGLPPPPPKRGMTATPVHKPPRGKRAAITTENGPCTTILYQDFTVPEHATLNLFVYYKSQGPMTTGPKLNAENDMDDNQQFRIDLMKPGAALRSVDSADIVKKIFHTKTGDPRKVDPTKLAVGLGKLAGQNVRLRVAQTDNQAPLFASVDGVKVKTKH
jgi:hypothetical protein